MNAWDYQNHAYYVFVHVMKSSRLSSPFFVQYATKSWGGAWERGYNQGTPTRCVETTIHGMGFNHLSPIDVYRRHLDPMHL